MREAPSRVVIDELLERGAKVRAFDPVAMQEARRIYGDRENLEFGEDLYAVLTDADALIIVTECKIFRSPDFPKLEEKMRGKVVFDGRNVFDPKVARQHGFRYYGIGRQ